MVSEQEEILGARVPLLKIVEKETQIAMDISFNVLDGVKAIEPIKALIKKHPPLRPLVLIVKSYLRERGLNETYKGGIGSFLLLVLIVAFLQQERKEQGTAFANATLG